MITKFYAVVYHPKQGKAIWSTGFKTEKEARLHESKMLLEFEQDSYTRGKEKFRDVAALWLESSVDTYANSTYQGYAWYVEHYLNPVFGEMYIDKIEPKHLQIYVNELGKRLSAETVNKNINILSNVFNYGVTLKLLKQNTIIGIKRKRVVVAKHKTWSTDQIKKFLEFEIVKSSDYYDMILLNFITGMRPSELCGIALGDISKKGVLTLNRGYDRYGELSDMKTQRSHRSIQLPNDIKARLLARISQAEQEAELKQIEFDSSDFLFKNCKGAPVNPSVYSKAFQRYLKAFNVQETVKLPQTCLYNASRHSFGTNLIINENVPTSIVSSIMGNSERVLTSRYVHVTNAAQSHAINAYTEKFV